MELELFRGLERLLIVFFAGTSIILGWHLFKIGVVSPQSGTLSGKGFSVTLQKVGPGIFFSLFGAIILSIAIFRGLSVNPYKYNEIADQKNSSSYYLSSTKTGFEVEKLHELTLAINSLSFVSVEHSSQYPSNRKIIQKAIDKLTSFRKDLVKQALGSEAINNYEACNAKDKSDSCHKTNEYKEVKQWYVSVLSGSLN